MRKPKRRSNLTEMLTLAVSPEQVDMVDLIAERLGGVSRGAVLRIALAEYIDRHSPGEV